MYGHTFMLEFKYLHQKGSISSFLIQEAAEDMVKHLQMRFEEGITEAWIIRT